jgi:hypothetical protein
VYAGEVLKTSGLPPSGRQFCRGAMRTPAAKVPATGGSGEIEPLPMSFPQKLKFWESRNSYQSQWFTWIFKDKVDNIESRFN